MSAVVFSSGSAKGELSLTRALVSGFEPHRYRSFVVVPCGIARCKRQSDHVGAHAGSRGDVHRRSIAEQRESRNAGVGRYIISTPVIDLNIHGVAVSVGKEGGGDCRPPVVRSFPKVILDRLRYALADGVETLGSIMHVVKPGLVHCRSRHEDVLAVVEVVLCVANRHDIGISAGVEPKGDRSELADEDRDGGIEILDGSGRSSWRNPPHTGPQCDGHWYLLRPDA